MSRWLFNRVGLGVHDNYHRHRFRVYGDRIGARTGAGRDITMWALHVDLWRWHGYVAVSS